MGQTSHPGQHTGVALLAVAVLTAGLLTGCGTNVAGAATVLGPVVDATIVHADGSTVSAVRGARLKPGDQVHTGPTGWAELDTLGRRVELEPSSAVTVRNGASARLWQGSVVIDALAGPGESVQASDLQVHVSDSSVVRIDHSYTIRVGTLAGKAQVTSVTGRSADVPALLQVASTGQALSEPTPLTLSDDAAEKATGLSVVSDDVLLNQIARSVNSYSTATRSLTHAVLQLTSVSARSCRVQSVPVGEPPSEHLLPLAIADAASAQNLCAVLGTVLTDRQEGGSWGVVAHLVRTDAYRTVDRLTALESTPVGSSRTSFQATLVAAAAAASIPPGVHPTPEPTSAPPGPGGTPSPTGGSPSHSPSGRPSPSPTGNVLGVLSGLLGSPTPTPTGKGKVSPSPIIPPLLP